MNSSVHQYHSISEEKKDFYLLVITKFATNGLSLFSIIATFTYMLHLRMKNYLVLSTIRDRLIFVLLIQCFLFSLLDLYYPNERTICIITKVLMNITQQTIIASLILICSLVQMAIHKNISKYFMIYSLLCYFFIILFNIPVIFDYIKNTNIQYDEAYMTCHIKKYTNNNLLSMVVIVVPLILAEIYAIYILFIGSNYLKNFPEKTTRKLIYELKFYPIIIIICFSGKIIKHILKFYDLKLSTFLIILDNRGLSCLGIFISFIYFWKFKELNIKKMFVPRKTFTEPTQKELNEFSYY